MFSSSSSSSSSSSLFFFSFFFYISIVFALFVCLFVALLLGFFFYYFIIFFAKFTAHASIHTAANLLWATESDKDKSPAVLLYSAKENFECNIHKLSKVPLVLNLVSLITDLVNQSVIKQTGQ